MALSSILKCFVSKVYRTYTKSFIESIIERVLEKCEFVIVSKKDLLRKPKKNQLILWVHVFSTSWSAKNLGSPKKKFPCLCQIFHLQAQIKQGEFSKSSCKISSQNSCLWGQVMPLELTTKMLFLSKTTSNSYSNNTYRHIYQSHFLLGIRIDGIEFIFFLARIHLHIGLNTE